MSRLAPLAAVLGALAPLSAQAASTCDTWGQVSPSEKETWFGEFVDFRVAGGRGCGDVDTCSWWADGTQGDFLQTTGSPVTWRAPQDPGDCVTLELRVWASCTDGNTTGYSDVTVRCTHEQLAEVQANRGASISGGGCNGPLPPSSSSVPALLLLPAFGFARRRRDR